MERHFLLGLSFGYTFEDVRGELDFALLDKHQGAERGSVLYALDPDDVRQDGPHL